MHVERGVNERESLALTASSLSLSVHVRDGVFGSMKPKQKYIIALVHIDMEHGYVGDIIEGVGPRGTVVQHSYEAKRYSSLKRALNIAQDWAWYADHIRVMAVDE